MAATQSENHSGRLMRKGVLVEETYRIFACWDLSASLRLNLSRFREQNPIGASNAAWLKEVVATLSNRFSAGDPITPLVILAKRELAIGTWKYCLLWHLHSTDGLFSAFMREFLAPRIEFGTVVFTTEDVMPYVQELQSRGVFGEKLSDYGVRRMGRDLLRAAGEFGLLDGQTRREFHHPVIPEDALLYAIYSLWETVPRADRLIASDRWRQFLMTPFQVEHELLNLHQFHRLRYERAGSVGELNLPHNSLADFCQSLVP
ncbi:MAG: DUF1819 family protein [Verrucomicrobia bacterium]|nr:DUF1819 family protein [Verrucomicrobiota bacterium]